MRQLFCQRCYDEAFTGYVWIKVVHCTLQCIGCLKKRHDAHNGAKYNVKRFRKIFWLMRDIYFCKKKKKIEKNLGICTSVQFMIIMENIRILYVSVNCKYLRLKIEELIINK